MHYVGLMSGTSMDAIDVALVRFENQNFETKFYEQYPIADEIRSAVRHLSLKSDIEEISRLDVILGELFADAVICTLEKTATSLEDITAIGSHGQTILHLPNAKQPRTLQIGNPNIIACKTGITTVADFRRMDVAAGGQGAPLAPAFHASYLRSDKNDRVILNIGGIANITLLPASSAVPVTGFDTGPGNGLLDDWNFKHNATYMDRDCTWAKTGTVNNDLLTELLNDSYFLLAPPKSTGRDIFNLDWVMQKVKLTGGNISAENIQATLLALTTLNIANAIKTYAALTREVFVCGGGAHNLLLMQKLGEELPGIHIATTEEIGIDPDSVEAVTFAWLAKCRLDGVTGNLPTVTGARQAVLLGAIYKS